jgi:RND family efflux transporter MFP subunit
MNKVMMLMLSGFALLAGCKRGAPAVEPVKNVKIANPTPLGATTEKYFPGVIKETAAVNLGFKAAGQILRVCVREGQRVQQGELIAELDAKDYRLQLEATEAQYAQVTAEVERVEALYRRKSVSGNDYEKAVAGKKMLAAKLQADRNMLAYTRLSAPFAGYIQSVRFEPSEMVDAGMPVATLLDVRRLLVEINLPASLYVDRESFVGFACLADVLPDKVFPLTLVSINPKADGHQLYRALLQLDPKHDARLAAGMTVRVSITCATHAANACSLPLGAVFGEDGKSYVWVADTATNRVSKREVKVEGLDGKGGVSISAGVTCSDRVVVAGAKSLRENQQVQAIPEPSEANVGGLL